MLSTMNRLHLISILQQTCSVLNISECAYRPCTLNALGNIFIFKDLCNNLSLCLKTLHFSNNISTFFLHACIQRHSRSRFYQIILVYRTLLYTQKQFMFQRTIILDASYTSRSEVHKIRN